MLLLATGQRCGDAHAGYMARRLIAASKADCGYFRSGRFATPSWFRAARVLR